MNGEAATDPVDDAVLVARIRAGDREAWADVYRRYKDRLYTLSWSVLHSDEASDATHDAFLLAFQHIDSLRDPTALRPWLLRIAWTEALRRGKKRPRSAPLDEAAFDAPSVEPGPDDVARRHELQRLVWDAAAGLPPEDRVVLELNVHQGLSGDELANAIGVSPSYARKLVQRVRARTDRALGALLVATQGRQDCAELQGILGNWDGQFTPLVRKRVARHVDGCQLCSTRRASMTSPVALLAAAPLLPAPAAIGQQVLAASAAAASVEATATSQAGLQLASLAPRRTAELAAGGVAAAIGIGVIALLLLPRTPALAAPVNIANAGLHEDLAVAVDGNGRAFVAWQDLDASVARSMARHETTDGWSESVNLAEGFTNPSAATLLPRPHGQMCAFFHGIPNDTDWLETYGLYERCWDGDELSGPRQMTSIGEFEEFQLTTGWKPGFDTEGNFMTAWETPPGTVGVHHQVVSAEGNNGFGRLVIDRDGRFHVLFYHGDTGNIDHRWSGDDGVTWSDAVPVAGYAAFDVAADGQGGIHVADSSGGGVFDHRWALDSGWSEPINASGDGTNYLTYAGLAGLDDGGAVISWSAAIGGENLSISERRGNGPFGPTSPVAAASGVRVSESELAADGEHLHLAWIADDGSLTYQRLR